MISSFCEAGASCWICARRMDPRGVYVPDEDKKNGRESPKIWLSHNFSFLCHSPSCLLPASSDQSVFITVARDLLSFGFLFFALS
jgi:hypothetical protein